jgi:hypothetical protein
MGKIMNKKQIVLTIATLLSFSGITSADYVIKFNSSQSKGMIPEKSVQETFPSCKDILENDSSSADGIYTINKGSGETNVYCDMSGGGWTLLDNFVNDESVEDKYGEAYGLSKIYNIDLLSQAGYTTYLNRFNREEYHRESDYLQIYYSGSPVGYMKRTLPDIGSEVKVKLGNWYSGSTFVEINGSNVLNISEAQGMKTYIGSFNNGDVLEISENGIIWIGSIWIK